MAGLPRSQQGAVEGLRLSATLMVEESSVLPGEDERGGQQPTQLSIGNYFGNDV